MTSLASPELNETTGWVVEAAQRADGTLGLLTRTGSRAYGTERTDSDHDFRGVYFASMQRFCSLGGVQDSLVLDQPHDTTVYELNHFARLAAKGNPTMLETLWGNEFVGTYHGRLLREHRHLFLSTRVLNTYGGYAMSQLGRAKRGTGGSRGAEHHRRTKFRLHTLRLLYVAQSILEIGEVMVRLPDHLVADLKDVSANDGLDAFERRANEQFEKVKRIARYSSLPEAPDEDAINHLLYKLRATA